MQGGVRVDVCGADDKSYNCNRNKREMTQEAFQAKAQLLGPVKSLENIYAASFPSSPPPPPPWNLAGEHDTYGKYP